MRRRPLFWLCLSLLFFAAAAYFWRFGNDLEARRHAAPVQAPAKAQQHSALERKSGKTVSSATAAAQNVSAALPPYSSNGPKIGQKPKNPFKNRLSNTTLDSGELAQKDKSLLLENALLDTEQPIGLDIPGNLRSAGDPGAYIVQGKGPLTDAFRQELLKAGATVVSYIPNNAYLVRAPLATAQSLAAAGDVQTVLSFEPYYKLKPSLLDFAVTGAPLPDGTVLNMLLFKDAKDSTLSTLKDMGVDVLAQDQTPFGPMVKVRPAKNAVATLARLSGVHEMEFAHRRVGANDLSRAALGVSSNSTTQVTYLGLTGNGVLVDVNDTGVDATHPDLSPKVAGDFPISLIDSNGHGTFIAGVIASSGASSLQVTNAEGSVMPPTNGQFRGMAPNAKIYSIALNTTFDPTSPDTAFGANALDSYLQESALKTNAFICNNSWHYFSDNDYDLAAASYDAAVRDALPQNTNSQPLIFVFPAGNTGGGADDGTGGSGDGIESPGTAKNVITVGSVEEHRNITNETAICRPVDTGTNISTICTTNKPWQLMTDSDYQIASFSGRGNVSPGTEGTFGRFKPDVVSPGTFVISTKSQQWDQKAYFNPTNYHFDFIPDNTVETNSLEPFALFVPYNAVQVIIQVFADVDLPIFVRRDDFPTTNTFDFVETNIVTIPTNTTLNPVETDWFYAVGNPTTHDVNFSVQTTIITTNDLGNYLQVLSNMDNSLGPYRYESGTSISAASVSGMLALMQEQFEQRLHTTNSPAMMKALVINGARSLSSIYTFNTLGTANAQGWGIANLTNSVHTNVNFATGPNSMLLVDQSPASAVTTGDKRTYNIQINNPDAIVNPLRVTLAWTDPPGNPLAGLKLVNDLDLIVTNMDNTNVFYGNDFSSGDFNTARLGTNDVAFDAINNVENVFLQPPLGSNYMITVFGHRVNVNAVTAHPNGVAQDFALVVSSGNGEVPDAIQFVGTPNVVGTNLPFVSYQTNQFIGDPLDTGAIVADQHSGASSPFLGTNTTPVNHQQNFPTYDGTINVGVTNQWHFYAFTNENGFTNAEFVTFFPATLSIPRMGVRETDIENATRPGGDVDIYVSKDPAITNLDPAVLLAADKSLGRGGEEIVVLSNATRDVYFVGVKSESAEGGDYSVFGAFSIIPFST
ncbi:MAG TPA: S8 family serine peptidase, partial [Candidatus Dormibacteraeota bacterium]|nr:S8 family serine peptidase [Candidatus Dormibacteraeota bacterium]